MSVFYDPRIFNYVLLVIYALCVVRWAIHGSLVDTVYWVAVIMLQCCITWGYQR